MFCPPGFKVRASSRLSRKKVAMQKKAMDEAVAAGWRVYEGEEESSSEEEGNIEKVISVTAVPYEMLSPLDARYGKHSPNITSDSSEADDEDSLTESKAEDGTALVDEASLNALLDELRVKSFIPLKSNENVSPVEREASSFATPRFIPTEVSESTTKPTETETDFDCNGDIRAGNGMGEESENNSTGEGGSEADSLDLGVSTSVWPSQGSQEIKFFSPYTKSEDYWNDLDGEESLDDSVVEKEHEGNEIFLLTEGARYSEEYKNALFNIQEADISSYPIFELEPRNLNRISVNDLHGGDTDNSFKPGDLECRETKGDLKMASRHDNGTNVNDTYAQAQESTNAEPMDSGVFGSFQLMHLNSCEKSTTSPKNPLPSFVSPLASLVHPMNLDLFDSKSEVMPVVKPSSDRSMSSWSEQDDKESVASCPVQRLPSSILKSEQYTISESDDVNRRRNLASSFLSTTKGNRVAYNLSSGKKAMSKTQRVYSKSYLPSKPLLSPKDIPVSTRPVTMNHHGSTLSILLVDMKHKIFEVVTVDVNRETTIGDVLAKARSIATDPALSEQKYLSFCYGDQEFGAPMLPVNVVIDWKKHKTRPLVVAVPVGTTAVEMRSVKRVLWKNPKMKSWWQQQDPFQPKHIEKESRKISVPKTTTTSDHRIEC